MENNTIKILAIDDNSDNLITIKALIQDAFPDMTIATALSGAAGIELAKKDTPDVILLDVVMPEMDGFEACKILKATKNLADVPVIFVTALKTDKDSRIKALEVGADGFLSKPIDESELVAQLRAMLKIRFASIEKQNENVRLLKLVAERTAELKHTHTATLNLLEDLRNENEARKKIEQALSASEALYRSVIHASPDNITVTDLAGNITMISPKGLSLVGCTSESELIGKNINDSLLPEQRDRAIRNLQGMFQGIFNGPEEYTLLKADGSTVDTEINAEFVRNENGEPTGFVFAIRDITERKEAQNRIKESERKYRLITEKITDVVWIMDLSGKSLFVSQSVEDFAGYTVDEYLSQSINDRFTPESAQLAIQELRDSSSALVETNEPIHKYKKILILDYKCKDGNVKTGALLITPYFDEDNKLIGIHGVTRDITRRRKAEDAVRTSEEKYRSLVENSPNGIAIYQEGKFVYVNKAGLAIFGATQTEDLLGKPVLSVVHPDSMSAVVERVTQVAHGAEVPPLEEKLIRFDGSPFDAEVTALATTFNGKPAGQVIVSDITDRKLAVEKLRVSEEKFRDMANLLPQVVFEVKLTGEITYVNQQAELLFGYKTAELIGLDSLLVHIPEQRERVKESVLKKVTGNTIDSKEFIMLRKDGTVFPALIYINIILKEDEPVGLRGVVVDVTEQKEAERKIKESQAEYFRLYSLMRLMSDTMPDMLWAKDLAGNYTFANKAMCDRLLHANDTNEPIGKSDIFFAKREREAHVENPKWHTFGEICNDTDITTINKMQQMQFDEYGMVSGQFLYLDVHKAPLLNEKNELIGVVGTARDITERKLAEEKINYITRLYALLSHVNQAIVRIKDEVELFESVCRMAIEFGQFRMCWVGVFDEEKNILQPLCFAGHNDGYLEGLNIDPDNAITGSGPTGRAFKENKSYFCNDIATDDAMTHWREIALHRGYKSSFATPLHRKGKKYGILTLYASEVNFFDEEEQALLQGIGVDVSQALNIIDSESERITAEEALMTSEAKYRELMDNSPEGITIYVDGKVVYINKEALRLMRANDKSEMLGKTIVDFIHPDNRELVIERMKLVAMAPLNAILPSVEEKYIRLDGIEVYVEIKVMPILYDGKPAIQLSGHDITDRKEAELALEQSQSELKTIYDHAPVMMCVVDPERKIQFANEAFTALTGISEELMRGGAVGSVIGCINSFDAPKGCGYGPNCKDCGLRMAMEDTFNRGVEYQNVEYHSTLTVGSQRKEVYLLGSTSLIQTSNQKQVLLCLHDITGRKLAEDALHKSEMLLRTFIENSPFEIWARDNEQVGILENKKLTDHYGTIIGFTPESDSRVEAEIKELWRSINSRVFAGEIVDEEYEFMVNGEPRTFQQIVFPIEMNNVITGIAGFNIDVTERKKAEEKIRENNLKLEMAMQVSNMAWWEMDVVTGTVTFGRRKTDMIGYSPEDFNHYNDFMKLMHPDDYENSMQVMRNHLYGGTDKYEIEYRLLSASGDYKWFYDIGSVSKRDDNGKPLIVSGLIVDINYRKEAERELATQKQFFEQMFMQSSLSTQILDKDGWCERINPKLTQLFGVEPKHIEGHVYNIFEDEEIKRNGIVPELKKVFSKGETIEWEVLFDISVAADSQQIKISDGKKAWFSNWAYPIQNQTGEITHVIIQHTDITDKKLSEQALSQSREELKKFAAHLQNVREEERVLLAREIHDQLGQILVAVKIDMGMLKLNVLKNIDRQGSADLFDKFDNLSTLIDNTIKTARRIMTDLRPEVLDMLGFIDTVKQHLNGFQDRHKVICEFTCLVPELNLSSQQSVALFRIIQEAMNNIAKHAKATKVDVCLSFAHEKLVLEVSDNGVGFDDTSKKNHDSYGLIGMKERVFLLEGELSITSKKGSGTIVQVKIPYKK